MAEADGRLREPLDPDFQTLVDEIASSGAPPWDQLTAHELRALTRDLRKGGDPVAGVVTRDLKVEGAAGALDARLYTTEGTSDPGPGLVFFHGGGFTIGSIDTHDMIAAQLAAASSIRILSVDYRLAPEHRFPAAHEDALASSRWAFDHAAEIGFDPDSIAIGGDSAGANLAASTCLALREDAARHVRFQLLLYPNTTIEGSEGSRTLYAEGHYLTLPAAHHLFSHYVPTPEERQDPRIDLLRQQDLAGLPPTFLAIGTCDILLDECLAYGAMLEAAGVPLTLRTYPGFIHGFLGFGHRASAVAGAFQEIGDVLRQGVSSN